MKYWLRLLSSIVFIFFATACSNQETKRLEKENEELLKEYNKLNEEIESLSKVMKGLAIRDSILTDSIFKDTTYRVPSISGK